MDKAAERDHDTSDLLEVMREREKLEDERRKMVDALSQLSKEKRHFEVGLDYSLLLAEGKTADDVA